MSEWKNARLADVAEIRFSNVDKKTNTGELPVRLCNYMDVYGNGGYITADLPFMEASATRTEIERFRVETGDVIVTKDSETPDDIGIPAVVVDEIPDLVCGYHLALVKPNRAKIDSVYLAKQLGSRPIASHFSRLASGSTRYGLSSKSIASTSIPLAPLPQQRRIAEILSTVDEAIEQTEALIAKYQQIKAGLMHDLFTRGLSAEASAKGDVTWKLRPTYKQAPHLYKDSPIGWIPKEWEDSTLRESCEWFSGGTPSRSKSEWWSGDFPWLTPKDMKVFELSDTSEHITKEAALFGSRIVRAGTVFIVVRGMILAHSFPVVLSSKDFAFNQDIKAVQAGDRLTSRFLAYWFVGHTDLFLKKTTEATHGTKRFDLQEISKLSIGLPKPDEQNAIVTRLDSISTRMDSEQTLVAKLRQQKHGLMQDLLTGRVCVKVAEPASR